MTSTPSGKSTPTMTGSGHRSTSPLSPTRTSRLQEKADLQCLNDRLAVYIDRARQLEQENNRLMVQVHTSEETVRTEVTNIKHMYDVELSDARKMLDETAREKARLEIDLRRISDENADLKARYIRLGWTQRGDYFGDLVTVIEVGADVIAYFSFGVSALV